MTEAERRAAFVEANASVRLEGREPDAESLVLQERVIRGDVTIAQALVLATQRGSFDAIG